jgi:hypothetical protein
MLPRDGSISVAEDAPLVQTRVRSSRASDAGEWDAEGPSSPNVVPEQHCERRRRPGGRRGGYGGLVDECDPASNGAPSHAVAPPAPEAAPRVGVAYLLAVTCPMYGIGLSWGAQYAKVTPILQSLGISDSMLGIAWLAGPIAGIVVQPVVGDLSDRLDSRVGRRRLWMWIGVSRPEPSIPRGLSCFLPC